MSSLAFGLAAYLGGGTLPLQRSFAQLSDAVQKLGQWENSGDVTPEVLLQAINFALIDGYDIVTQRWLDYYTIDVDFPLTSGIDAYALSNVAPGFYKLRHLDFTSDATISNTTRFRPMLPHSLEGAHRYSGVSATSSRPPRYRVQGQSIVFAPPPIGGIVRVYYIPAPYQFSGAADTNEVIFDTPIEIRLVVQVAQRDILERNDLSTVDCDRKIGELTAKLRTAADSRDAGEPLYFDPAGPPRDWVSGGPDDDGWF